MIEFYKLTEYWYFGIFAGILLLSLFFWYQKNNKEKKEIFWQKNWNFKKVQNTKALKIIFLGLGILFLLFAFWRPQWGSEIQETSKKGLDLVFSVDVSKSMKALDFSTPTDYISRLDATKYLISNFVEKRKTDRVGLVEFAGESFVASPLTLDHSVFQNFLKEISSDDLAKQGTNLAEALEISLARLEIKNDKERSKAIILFSDGDETVNSRIQDIAKVTRDKGVKIYTIGVGSEKGMPIPDGRDEWGDIIYKKYHGKIVLTKLNPEPLKEIAKITGGEYFHAESISDLKALQRELDKLPKKILKDTTQNPNKEQYWIFALIGTILFILGFVAEPWHVVWWRVLRSGRGS